MNTANTETDEFPFEIEEDLPDPNEEVEIGEEGEPVATTTEVKEEGDDTSSNQSPSPPPTAKPKTPKAEQRIGQLTRKLRETEARLQQREAELQETVKRVGETEWYGLQAVSATLTKTREALLDKFKQAFEEGKTDEVTVVLQDLMQVDRQLDEATRYAAAEPAKPVTKTTTSPPLPAPPAALQDWMDKVNYTELAAEDKQLVTAMAAKLEREGYDFRRPDFYTQLDSRLGGMLNMGGEDTETETAAPQDRKPAPSKPVRPAVAGPSRRPVMAGTPTPAAKVTVSREALGRLSHMGIDLNDKEMRMEYLKYRNGVNG